MEMLEMLVPGGRWAVGVSFGCAKAETNRWSAPQCKSLRAPFWVAAWRWKAASLSTSRPFPVNQPVVILHKPTSKPIASHMIHSRTLDPANIRRSTFLHPPRLPDGQFFARPTNFRSRAPSFFCAAGPPLTRAIHMTFSLAVSQS